MFEVSEKSHTQLYSLAPWLNSLTGLCIHKLFVIKKQKARRFLYGPYSVAHVVGSDPTMCPPMTTVNKP